jgi:hypothetical protein
VRPFAVVRGKLPARRIDAKPAKRAARIETRSRETARGMDQAIDDGGISQTIKSPGPTERKTNAGTAAPDIFLGSATFFRVCFERAMAKELVRADVMSHSREDGTAAALDDCRFIA